MSMANSELRHMLLALLLVLFALVPSTPSEATDPRTICFAGSGKPKIDIVMCTRALMPAKALTRATLLMRRARARIQLEDDARALDDLTEALAINPLSSEALTEKARALRFLDRPEEAREALNEALQISPNNTVARTTRGVLALTLGDHAGAISDLSAVIASKPGSG
ncbi:MAG: tetratricopeptide repeat protein, partial [Pseudomonadota bacterium]